MEAERTELYDLSSAQPDRAKKMATMWDNWAKIIGVQPWPMPRTPPGERIGKMPVPHLHNINRKRTKRSQ